MVRARELRLVILLDVAAMGAVVTALLLGLGLPFAVRGGGLGAGQLVALAVLAPAAGAALGGVLLARSLGRPVDRILSAADALGGAAGELPLLAPPGDASGRGLSRIAVAFERIAAALTDERARLAGKVFELERANAELVRARESLLRADRLATVGRLASGIAHEVGNPLGAITGYVELARERLRPCDRAPALEQADDFLARIGAEAERIDAIVRDLLDFARPPAAGPGDVELGAAIHAAVRLARVQARFRDVDVEVELGGAARRVVGDERRLAQVFLNLVLNAADAMDGRGRVHITGRTSGRGAPRVVVDVADTGPGIAPEHLSRVFDPFFTTKPPGKGTGLGLAVCHGIVESFGGTITASNLDGGGAAFHVELPCSSEDPA